MQNLPLFPEFRRFSIDDREWYDAFFKEYKPYADFSFGNFVVWLDQYDDLLIAQHHENIVFSSTVLFMGGDKITTFIGKHNVVDTVQAIFEFQLAEGKQPIISGVTDVVADDEMLTSSGKFLITTDRENFEYLYDANSWASLEGSEMRKLRREVNTFTKENGDKTSIKPLDLNDPTQIKELQLALAEWTNTFSHNDADQSESLVLNRLFSLASKLPYKANGLYVGGQLEGFLIYQTLPQQTTACFSHVKASYKYRYMFDYLLHASAQIALDQGITQINFEQDLGIQGLRTHKESLKPTGFFEKFTIQPAVDQT